MINIFFISMGLTSGIQRLALGDVAVFKNYLPVTLMNKVTKNHLRHNVIGARKLFLMQNTNQQLYLLTLSSKFNPYSLKKIILCIILGIVILLGCKPKTDEKPDMNISSAQWSIHKSFFGDELA